jgi:hypothetical protein
LSGVAAEPTDSPGFQMSQGHVVNTAGALPSTGPNHSGAGAVPLLLALVGALTLLGAGAGHRRRRALRLDRSRPSHSVDPAVER